jgi:hypothetical protein
MEWLVILFSIGGALFFLVLALFLFVLTLSAKYLPRVQVLKPLAFHLLVVAFVMALPGILIAVIPAEPNSVQR